MKKHLLLLMLLVSTACLAKVSGLEVGETTPAHRPQHITGPDANTDTCPV